MAAVEGVGGIFIDSEDAERLARWYETMLGIEMEAHPDGIGYYHVFLTRDVATSRVRENPVLAINHAQQPLAERGRGFLLNLRVDDLHAILAELRTRGVTVEEQTLEWARGKHGWIRDLDGNRIELYEEVFPDEAT
jgi:catechol 2,3-dioxygenase-like lactoylglutathione lyase family enzyme